MQGTEPNDFTFDAHRHTVRSCFGPTGSWSRVSGWSLSRVKGLGSRVRGVGYRVKGVGPRVKGLGSRV